TPGSVLAAPGPHPFETSPMSIHPGGLVAGSGYVIGTGVAVRCSRLADAAVASTLAPKRTPSDTTFHPEPPRTRAKSPGPSPTSCRMIPPPRPDCPTSPGARHPRRRAVARTDAPCVTRQGVRTTRATVMGEESVRTGACSNEQLVPSSSLGSVLDSHATPAA